MCWVGVRYIERGNEEFLEFKIKILTRISNSYHSEYRNTERGKGKIEEQEKGPKSKPLSYVSPESSLFVYLFL